MQTYESRIVWTGNSGEGTAHYRAYARTWDIAVPGKPLVHCSNDPLMGGDPSRMNPEDLLLSALSACHMLWYLHYASEAGVVVTRYEDTPVGAAELGPGGAGRFTSAELRPVIWVALGADMGEAAAIHDKIHKVCFIARSVNFPVTYAPEFRIED
ncbi:OsmC family peroxiredoxin (plasmid) [Pseudorhodobacter turbinis]|uniref:OsmC family peroxiredoxin n=1 Tax=Pseudorhodobacter turbinis TaxID=2500533 RepID=A0A4P8EJW9_9RHOB|nr:OsmC family protein [Pseudorhodobacter turbinis]QCO57015.1 OsmC family peroxiredoxin [Pseudorhodobacter turbinis]